jgi:nucleoside phosphorylase
LNDVIDRNCPVILFALDRECGPFRRMFQVQTRCREAPCRAWICAGSEKSFLVMEIGVGPVPTQRALDWLGAQWKSGPPPLLIMAGFAGSLTAEIRVGDVFVATDVVDLEGNRWLPGWPGPAADIASTGCTAGRLITTPRLIGDPEEKGRLKVKHAAQAVDMEAATVAEFCRSRGVSFGCVRSISDNVDTCLSPHLVSLLGTGQVSIPRLLATLVLHPSVLGSLLTLARDTRWASRSLAEALMKLLG